MDTFMDYARRGRNAAWRYLATTLLAFLVAMAIGVLILVPLQMSGLAPPDLDEQLVKPTRPEVFFVATGLLFSALALGLVLAARWVQAKRLGDLVGRWRWPAAAKGAAIWTAALAAATLVDWLIAPGAFAFTGRPDTARLALFALLGLAPQVFAEELIFRGFVTQAALLALKREWLAAVASGVIFGAMHIPNGTPQAVSATIFGILAAFLAIRLGGIAFPYGIHLANNFLGAVVVVSADDVFRGMPGVISQSSPHLLWWDVFVVNSMLLAVTYIATRKSVKPSLLSRTA